MMFIFSTDDAHSPYRWSLFSQLMMFIFSIADVRFPDQCCSINVILATMFNRGCTFHLQPKYHAESTNSDWLLVAINILLQSFTLNLLNFSFSRDSVPHKILKISRSNLNHVPWDNHLILPSSFENTSYLLPLSYRIIKLLYN